MVEGTGISLFVLRSGLIVLFVLLGILTGLSYRRADARMLGMTLVCFAITGFLSIAVGTPVEGTSGSIGVPFFGALMTLIGYNFHRLPGQRPG